MKKSVYVVLIVWDEDQDRPEELYRTTVERSAFKFCENWHRRYCDLHGLGVDETVINEPDQFPYLYYREVIVGD